MDNLKNYFLATAIAAVLYLGTAQISFGQNLLTNGNFTSFTTAPPTDGSGLDTTSYTTGAVLSSWTNAGYTFVFTNGNAGDLTITGSAGAFSLRGPNNTTPTNNGLDLPPQPPGGANVVALDGAYEVGPLTQVVGGLTAGKTYAVSFDWAGAQQNGNYNTATTDSFSVALGAATGVFTAGPGGTSGTLAGSQTTAVADNVAHGFTGWMTQTFDFTATGSSETLYFLANGTPTGEPPFALLSDVSLTVVPEPATSATWTLLFGMLILAGNRGWRLYRKRAVTN